VLAAATHIQAVQRGKHERRRQQQLARERPMLMLIGLDGLRVPVCAPDCEVQELAQVRTISP
jgi:hypothetical protein